MFRTLPVAITVLLATCPTVALGGDSATATGISRQMNPAVSLNALFMGQWNDDTRTAAENFIDLQEAEIQFSSVVDPFWTADVIVAFHPASNDGHGHGLETHIEVASLRSTAMPSGLGLEIGKFFLPVGKHALLHTHQQPFARAPLAQTSFLGHHGLAEVGAKIDATVPLPWWSELEVYVVDGDAEVFDADDRQPAFGAHWSNLWDVSDGGTLEAGGSWLHGPAAQHDGEDGEFNLATADLTWKWVSPTRSQGPAAQVSAELYLPDPEHAEGDPLGWFLHAQTRVHRDWWLGVGYGHVDDLAADGHDHELAEEQEQLLSDWREWKAALTYAPSEFSSLRAEISQREKSGGEVSDLRVAVQWNFTIGSHPAHLY